MVITEADIPEDWVEIHDIVNNFRLSKNLPKVTHYIEHHWPFADQIRKLADDGTIEFKSDGYIGGPGSQGTNAHFYRKKRKTL
jgi:hypothetical protein